MVSAELRPKGAEQGEFILLTIYMFCVVVFCFNMNGTK